MARRCWCTAGEVSGNTCGNQGECVFLGEGGVGLGLSRMSHKVTLCGEKVLVHCWGGEEPKVGIRGRWERGGLFGISGFVL